MRQPGRPPLPPAAGGEAGMPPYRRMAHPVARYAWMYGAVSGLFAILQVAVSVSGALESRGAIDSLYYGMNNSGGFNPIMVIQWLAPAMTATYGTCLLGFAASMWMCWLAGRDAARAAGRRSAGVGAGLLTSLVSSGIWIAASIAAVLIVHTEGSISGVLTTTPTLSPTLETAQVGWLVGQEVVAGLIALGFGVLAGRIGAGAARVAQPVSRMPAWPPPPPFIAYPPYPPYVPSSFGTPQSPGAAPFVVTRMPPVPPGAVYPPQPWGSPAAWQGPLPPYPPAVPYPPYPAAWPPAGSAQPAWPPAGSAPPAWPPAPQPGAQSYSVAPAQSGESQPQPPANSTIAPSGGAPEQPNGQHAAEGRSDG